MVNGDISPSLMVFFKQKKSLKQKKVFIDLLDKQKILSLNPKEHFHTKVIFLLCKGLTHKDEKARRERSDIHFFASMMLFYR